MNTFLSLILFLIPSSLIAQDSTQKIQNEIGNACAVQLTLNYNAKLEKFGYLSESGNIQISPTYICATPFIDCIALVSDNSKTCMPTDGKHWWYINKSGKMVVGPRKENRKKWEQVINAK